MLDIFFSVLSEGAKVPTRGSSGAAGYDLYAAQDVTIPPGGTGMIPLGFATEIPSGYFAAVYSRSGMATKEGLRVCQGTAVIDEDYRGEWKIPLFNQSGDTKIVHKGDRVAQAVFQPYECVMFAVVDKLHGSDRGEGGFGSTGKN